MQRQTVITIAKAVVIRQVKNITSEESKIVIMDNIQAIPNRKSGKYAVIIIGPTDFRSR